LHNRYGSTSTKAESNSVGLGGAFYQSQLRQQARVVYEYFTLHPLSTYSSQCALVDQHYDLSRFGHPCHGTNVRFVSPVKFIPHGTSGSCVELILRRIKEKCQQICDKTVFTYINWVAWLHFLLCAGPQLLEYEGYYKSIPDHESLKEQIKMLCFIANCFSNEHLLPL
jgi:hypothetical protein